MTTIFIPADAQAVALGADRVARAIAQTAQTRNVSIEIVRTGSRGLFWLEPMVEIATAQGRVAFGPVKPHDVVALFDADFISGGDHALRLGAPEQIDFLAKQTRFTFARCGIVDPLSPEDYVVQGRLRRT